MYVYVAGSAYVAGNGRDIATVQYDASNGSLTWQGTPQYRTYGGTGIDIGVHVEADAYGNAYVTGILNDGSSADYVTIKYDINGVRQWYTPYNGTANGRDDPVMLRVDQSNTYVYVTGNSINSEGRTGIATICYLCSNGSVYNNPKRYDVHGIY